MLYLLGYGHTPGSFCFTYNPNHDDETSSLLFHNDPNMETQTVTPQPPLHDKRSLSETEGEEPPNKRKPEDDLSPVVVKVCD